MRSQTLEALAFVFLGIAIVVFYTTYVTAATYYNPVATAVIVLLGVTIAVSGVVLTRLPDRSGTELLKHRFVARSIASYPYFFGFALLLLGLDMSITLYALTSFGTSVEANRVVAGLFATGNLAVWAGQQFTPVLIAGGLFALVRNVYVRAAVTFYTIGTVGYALATVLNDIFVVLSIGRA